MDYKIMWIYLKESLKKSEMGDVTIDDVLNTMEIAEWKEKNGELIQFEIDDRVKWAKKLLDEDNFDEAIRITKGIVELKLKQFHKSI